MRLPNLDLTPLPETFAICRLPAGTPIPGWATTGPWFSITQTPEEVSIVCEQGCVPPGMRMEGDWRALKVAGPLDFSLTGVLAALAGPLADAGISLFAVSTFDTDYVLVKAETWARAIHVLRAAGHALPD